MHYSAALLNDEVDSNTPTYYTAEQIPTFLILSRYRFPRLKCTSNNSHKLVSCYTDPIVDIITIDVKRPI